MKIAVIPARGGSKRIPRKNAKLFNGRPIISYSIEAALKCGIFDQVLVSTDDENISTIALEFGAQAPFCRPAELSDDFTPTVPVISHAISKCMQLGWGIKDVCCIYPCAPFISIDDLRLAYEKLSNDKANYVFPVTTFPSPIQRALRREPNGSVLPFEPQYASTRSQDLELGFFDVGQFYWGTSEAWLSGHNVHLTGQTIVIPNWRAVDIDTPEDWERAELIYEALIQKNRI